MPTNKSQKILPRTNHYHGYLTEEEFNFNSCINAQIPKWALLLRVTSLFIVFSTNFCLKSNNIKKKCSFVQLFNNNFY
jgi:hypothetical protein